MYNTFTYIVRDHLFWHVTADLRAKLVLGAHNGYAKHQLGKGIGEGIDVRIVGYQRKAGQTPSLTVRPELRACRAVEGWTVKPDPSTSSGLTTNGPLNCPALSW